MRASHSNGSIARKVLATSANAKLTSFCSLTLAVLAEARIRPEATIEDRLLAVD